MSSPAPIKLGLFHSLSSQEKINFTRHLAIIVKAGLPLLEGLKIVRRQTASKTLSKIADDLIININNGQSLSRSLEKYRSAFGDFYISIVEVGEASGTLASNLLYLAEEMKKIKDLKSKVRSAMIYPAILFAATILVSSFLTFFIFPKIIVAFSSLNVELPITTRALISALSFLRVYGWMVGVGLVFFYILMRFLLKIERIRLLLHMMYLKLPVVSHLVIDLSMANFSRILSILLKSGIKIVEAIIIVGNTFENLVYKNALHEVAEEIKRGESFSDFLLRRKDIFPPILSAMIEVGENTGNLEENLVYLSGYYSEEVDNSLRNLTALVEPIILLLMGLIVGFVAVSIITPIYSITQGLK